MKVLIINHFPLRGSGSGVYTHNIAKSLVKKGHEVCIVMPENESVKNENGIAIEPIYFNNDKLVNSLPFNFPCFTTHPRSNFNFKDLTDEQFNLYMNAFKNKIDEVIEYFKPDIIHGQHIWLLSYLGIKDNIPLVVTCHGTDLIGIKENAFYRDYAFKVAEKAHNIISISAENEKMIKELFGEKLNIVKIKNGYDNNVFYIDKVERQQVLNTLKINKKFNKIVVFTGKLTEIKGVDVLLKAATIYEDSDTLTVIIGDGNLYNELKNLATKLNLNNIIFIGNKEQNEIRKILNIANVAVVPSRYEAFGLVAIEALACGVPVAGTYQGGLLDIVNKDNGVLVEVDNYHELALAIKSILGNEKNFDKICIAENTKNKYSQESLIDELINVYNDAINNIKTD